MDLNIHCTW